MPPKRRGRKPAAAKKTRSKKDKDPLAQIKRKELELIFEEFDRNVENRCASMKADLLATCSKLQMLYQTALLTIPKMYHSMTKAQYKDKLENKASELSKTADDEIAELFDLSSEINMLQSLRAATAKKKKQKAKIFSSASKIQKKFSKDSSMNSSMTNSRATRRALAKMQAAATPVSRQIGLPVNYTPKMKSSAFLNAPAVVTPKFDPRKPLSTSLLRKPKAGEIVMSMSGSPLQVPSIAESSKPGLIVSLGEGQVLNVGDPTSLNKMESKLDQSTLQALRLVNEQLNRVLAS